MSKIPKKVFAQDLNDDFQMSDEEDVEIEDLKTQFQRNQKLPSPPQQLPEDENTNNYQYKTLKQLIEKLNDEDHSEDEGIQDYKIGGYHPCHVGQVLANRYVLIQKLGWGHFSTVWLSKDFKYGNYVAVKIMKSSPHYLEASYDQVEILQKVASYSQHPQWIQSLKKYEPGKQKFERDDTHVLNLLNSFLFKGPYGNHFCMVFQILGVNLLQVLKRYDYKGLPLDLVKEITRQVLMGLDFLNRICRVIHTDLKPQNVLLCLTDQQIKQIVQKGQLSSKQLYKDRLSLYRHKYGLGPTDQSSQQQEVVVEKPQQIKKKKEEVKQSDQQSESENQTGTSTIHLKISQYQAKVDDPSVNKKLKKTYRRKIKKLQTTLSQMKQKQQKKQEDKKIVVKNKRTKKTQRQLFSAFDTKLAFDKGPKLQKGFKVKIADLGNACWEHHHFATQIQTRQYRGPQVLTGSKYNLSADMWSLACMTFEMLTGQLLFNPRKDNSQNFGKNDDHLAQMMELLGRFPKKFSMRGVKAKKYFSKEGNLRRIPKLQNWSLKDVMVAKYRFSEEQAQFFQDFMTPMLNCYPERRKLADQMLNHAWLSTKSPEDYFMTKAQHEKIKAQRYDTDVQKDQLYQYESQNQDGDNEDNAANDSQGDDEFYGYEKVGDIRYIDRSFMDLGYIGYGEGIFLQKLDTGANWQFQV